MSEDDMPDAADAFIAEASVPIEADDAANGRMAR